MRYVEGKPGPREAEIDKINEFFMERVEGVEPSS
jgi:hypothetical protein